MTASPPCRSTRVPFVDVARGLAYVLMVIAHVAPSDGPARMLLVSEFLTAPLFALLVGAGAQLAAGRATSAAPAGSFRPGAAPPPRPDGLARVLLHELPRAAAVFALGLLLARSDAQVVIVLMHLAVLMLLSVPLARLRNLPLALATAGAAVLAVAVPLLHTRLLAQAWQGGDPAAATALPLRVLGLVGGAGPYRLTGFLLCALLGMLAIRALRHPAARRLPVAAGATTLALGTMLALLVAPNLLGLFPVHAYDGTPAEQLGVAAGALGVLLAAWTLQLSPLWEALPAAVREAACAPGRMALTLYALQVGILHVHQLLQPGARDDGWWMLLLLLGAGLGAAVLWQTALTALARRHPGAGPWTRGPLEGAIALLRPGGQAPSGAVSR